MAINVHKSSVQKKKKKNPLLKRQASENSSNCVATVKSGEDEKGKRSLLTNEERSNASPWGSLELPTKTLGLTAFGRFTPKETKAK